MKTPTHDEILTAWKGLESAIQRVKCALPREMSGAIARLELQRRAFDDVVMGREPAAKWVEGEGG
jgi:hypothetical protein